LRSLTIAVSGGVGYMDWMIAAGIPPRRTSPILVAMVVAHAGLPARGAEITLTPTKDNTLIEGAVGDPEFSDGQGPLFSGTTNRDQFRRRALMEFDVASGLPAGSAIQGAQLQLNMLQAGPFPSVTTMNLQRVLADWGEGASFAFGGSGDL